MSDYNQHLANAVESVQSGLVIVTGQNVEFPIQSGPIAAEGLNGCDAGNAVPSRDVAIGFFSGADHGDEDVSSPRSKPGHPRWLPPAGPGAACSGSIEDWS